MCGIAAYWGSGDPKAVQAMVEKQRHRGPDGDGFWSVPGGHLAHCRLAIMDPEHGEQPMISPDGNRVVVANGEIYNFPKLYERLKGDHSLFTRSDSETLLHLYEEEGAKMATELDGMFAFVLNVGNKLYAARDTLGIKPLYLGKKNDTIYFSSELKAFDGLGARVEEFPPGTWFDSSSGFTKYRGIPYAKLEDMSDYFWAKQVRNALEAAIVKRLMSDVPVGAFLSGGLDSSLIAAIARKHLKELHTFAVGLEGSPDLLAARRVADHIDSIHHEYAFTAEEAIRKLPEILYFLESFDQDLVRSAIPCYFVSQLAADHVKVVLTGEGADELFAGYTYYKNVPDELTLHKELQRSVASLHNMNLQRVDRMTMAQSIEGRVPFLDLEMISLAQRIPIEYKLREHQGRRTEKWILRKAGEGLLPDDILWRVKEQFDEGSGTAGLMDTALDTFMAEKDYEAYVNIHQRDRLRSREEAAYHSILRDGFTEPDMVLTNVARWTDRPL